MSNKKDIIKKWISENEYCSKCCSPKKYCQEWGIWASAINTDDLLSFLEATPVEEEEHKCPNDARCYPLCKKPLKPVLQNLLSTKESECGKKHGEEDKDEGGCGHALCSGNKLKEFGNRTLCELIKHEKKVFDGYSPSPKIIEEIAIDFYEESIKCNHDLEIDVRTLQEKLNEVIEELNHIKK